MKDFFTGLQFLTRVHIVKQGEWSPESFGRSVKYFPLVGAVIGLILTALYLALSKFLPTHILAAALVSAGIVITGGLHADGLMDTADGIFSGRSRERMLEIMKDSRVGANGVVAFGLLLLVKWSLVLDIPPAKLTHALFVMPVAARLAMVAGITLFPYARPEGIGKAFSQYAGRPALYIAAVITGLLVLPLGAQAFAGVAAGLVCGLGLAVYAVQILGGLTGDVYGAITELAEIVVLLVYLF